MPQPLRSVDSNGRRELPDVVSKSVELVQRGRMILDVATADLDAAETALGPFHETTWHFRNTLTEARRSWDRLRAEYGTAALDAALKEPPRTLLLLGNESQPKAVLAAIEGNTYRIERLKPTEIAESLWRLTRLPLQDDEPYYVARFADGMRRCDCAEWTYKVEQIDGAKPCKHVAGLEALGWLEGA